MNAHPNFPWLSWTHAEYHADRTMINHSALRTFAANRSVYRLRYIDGVETEPTESLDFGTAFHAYLLTPGEYAAGYAVAPSGRSKAADAERERIAAAGMTAVPAAWGPLFEDMAAAVVSGPAAGLLAAATVREQAFAFAWDGVACKAKPDVVAETADGPVIIDIKTARDPSPAGFFRAAEDYGYWTGAAFYRGGYRRAFGVAARYVIVAVGKSPPHDCAAYEHPDQSLLEGELWVSREIAALGRARVTNDWSPWWTKRIIPLQRVRQWKT